MKLHLGAGTKRWDGFVNVDLYGEQDLNCDIRKLPLDDGVADEIHSVHVFEHLYVHECESVMREWVRVLKPGGLMVVECPCADKVFAFIAARVTDPRLTWWPLYGDPSTHRSESDLHKWIWSKSDLMSLMTHCGLDDVKDAVPQFHVPKRDMRITGVKRGN